MSNTKDYRRKRVLGGKGGRRKVGKIAHAVFHPSRPLVVGFMVKRPDLLLMFKRKDRFVALDSLENADDGGYMVPPEKRDAWDAAACKRLGVDLDECIIWENMDLITDGGDELGRVGNVEFSRSSGKVSRITASDGSLARKLLGSFEIPLEMIRGYNEGHIVLKSQATRLEESGGLAAKAGAASAKAMHKVASVSDKASAGTEKAIDAGTKKAGEVLGKARKAVNDKYDEMAARSQDQTAAYKVGQALGGVRDKMRAWADPDDK